MERNEVLEITKVDANLLHPETGSYLSEAYNYVVDHPLITAAAILTATAAAKNFRAIAYLMGRSGRLCVENSVAGIEELASSKPGLEALNVLGSRGATASISGLQDSAAVGERFSWQFGPLKETLPTITINGSEAETAINKLIPVNPVTQYSKESLYEALNYVYKAHLVS